MQESERLEMVNSELKAQIEELRMERQQLMVMLNLHRPTCIVRTDSVKTPESEANPLLEQLSSEAKWKVRNPGIHATPKKKHGTTLNWIDITFLQRKQKHLSSELDILETLPKKLGIVEHPKHCYRSWLCEKEAWKSAVFQQPALRAIGHT